MAYIMDLAIVALFALMVYLGYRRGFIRTASGIVTFLVSALLASLLAGPLSVWVYDAILEPPITASVEQTVISAEDDASQQVVAVYEALPSTVRSLLAQRGVENAAMLEQVLPDTTESLSAQVCVVVREVVVPLVEVVASVALFLLAGIPIRWLLKLLNLAAKLPFLRTVNKTVGVLSGVLSGVLWVLFAVAVLQVLALSGVLGNILDVTTLDSTWLVKWLMTINPFATTVINYMK